MHYLTLIITLPLTVFTVLFALANRNLVTVHLWPGDDALSWTLPLYAVGLGLLASGFFLGALFVWIHSQKLRFRLWRESRRARRMEKELDIIHRAAEEKETSQASAGAAVSALASGSTAVTALPAGPGA